MSTVKYFHSAMTGAPTLNGTAGSLIAVLDACLVNGFGLRTVDSLVVSGNIATMTISAGHSFEPDTIALVSGATPAALNGEKVVLSTTTNTVTFAAPGVADQTATGAINCRLAPAGWEKLFSGANLAAYRSLDITSTRDVLRVDDTAAQNARVVGYESMSDINTGVNPFPTNSQRSGGLWWPKANSTATTARAWMLIGDQRTFYLFVNTSTNGSTVMPDCFSMTFGDFNSTKSGDAFSCYITGASSDISASTSTQAAALSYVGTGATDGFVPRQFTSLGTSFQIPRLIEYFGVSNAFTGASGAYTYPNSADNSLVLAPGILYENSNVLRGRLRGIMYPAHVLTTGSFNWRDKINGQGALANRKLIAVKSAGIPATATATAGTIFFDITGPWG